MRLEEQHAVERVEDAAVREVEGLDGHKIQLADPGLPRQLPPVGDHLVHLVDQVRAVNLKHDAPVDAQGTRIREEGTQIIKVLLPLLVGRLMGLQLQNLAVIAVPAAGPRLVRPRQAERHIQLRMLQEQLLGRLEQLLAIEPVVINGKAVDTVLLCQLHLPADGVQLAQVIVVVVERHAGLVMSLIERIALADVVPVGKALAPPLIVLRNRVKLRKIDRNCLYVAHIVLLTA